MRHSAAASYKQLTEAGTIYLFRKIFVRKEIFFILIAAWIQIILIMKPYAPCYNKTRIFVSSLPFIDLIVAIFICSLSQKLKFRRKIIFNIILFAFIIISIVFF